MLYTCTLTTPLGDMTAAANGEALVADRRRVPLPEVALTPGLDPRRGLGLDGQKFQEAHPWLMLLH